MFWHNQSKNMVIQLILLDLFYQNLTKIYPMANIFFSRNKQNPLQETRYFLQIKKTSFNRIYLLFPFSRQKYLGCYKSSILLRERSF